MHLQLVDSWFTFTIFSLLNSIIVFISCGQCVVNLNLAQCLSTMVLSRNQETNFQRAVMHF